MLVALAPGPAVAFDARANPFAYAGEYRDPASAAVYLRARWYQPSLPSFVSRDPAQEQTNHYGYGGGNPLMHVDPSGRSYRDFAGGLGSVLGRLNHGVGGNFSRVFLGQFLVPLQIVAAPGAFWRAMRHDTAGVDVFLAAGVALEAAAYIGSYSSAARTVMQSSGRRFFAGRVLGESVLGAGQAALGSFRDHLTHFHSAQLVQGLESIGGPEITYRLAAGIGYQPFTLTTGDVDRILQGANLQGSEALVFRMRIAPQFSSCDPHLIGSWTSPWQEAARLGTYHDGLFALTTDHAYQTELSDFGLAHQSLSRHAPALFADDLPTGSRLVAYPGWPPPSFEYVGRMSRFDRDTFDSNPRNASAVGDRTAGIASDQRTPVHWWRNNCHDHVVALIGNLGL